MQAGCGFRKSVQKDLSDREPQCPEVNESTKFGEKFQCGQGSVADVGEGGRVGRGGCYRLWQRLWFLL